MLSYRHMNSPVGRLKLVADDSHLVAVLWPDDRPLRVTLGDMRQDLHHPVLCEAKRQLTEFFKGDRRIFEVPIQFQGTVFQKRVWEQLLRIPYGMTRSYGHLAAAIGNRSASRAVGSAIGKNPLSIIVPCHRVIGATGKLTGFAGGLETKARLLELEGALRNGLSSSCAVSRAVTSPARV